MAANLSSVFVLFIFLHSISNIVQSEVIKRIYVPHSAPTGYYVTKNSKWANWELQDNLGKDVVPDLFSLSNTGELKTSQAMSERVGQVFVLSVVNDQLLSEGSDEIHIKIENASYMLQFSKQLYTGVISENHPAGMEVHGLKDLYANDNLHSTDSIKYRIVAGDRNKAFYLKPIYVNNKTENCLIARKTLDREEHTTYDLLIEAKSKSGKKAHSTIHVVVLDQDDNTPAFPVPRYTVSLKNDIQAGSSVFQIEASDPDTSKITYHMAPNKFFEIMPETGDIIVRGLEEADEHVYTLTIYATDSIGHRSEDVRVDIQIDSTLKFVRQRVRVRRAVRANLQYDILENKSGFLFSLQSTPINDNERFQLITSPSIFSVNSRSGDVSVQADQLDYDDSTKRQHILDFDITNTADPTSKDTLQVTVNTLNVNDEFPVFINKPVPFLAVISVTEHPGSVLYTLQCSDADPGSVIAYGLEAGGEGRFSVNPSSGAITTLGEGSYAINKVYTLSVSCEDVSTTGQKVEAQVEVMVGTRPPQFSEADYTGEVRENTVTGFRIKRVEALSFRGNRITYSLQTPPDSTQYFTLIPDNDANGAFIETLNSLDYESNPHQFTLQITASENDVLSSSVSIVIDLIDVNDNPPRFSRSTYPVSGIAEDTDAGTSILTVTATDLDSGSNAQITYSINNLNSNNEGDHFEVETREVGGVYEGVIKIKDPLDYEASPDHVYLFSITAVDHGAAPLTGTATVDVSVTNVNDEPPVFAVISAVPLREDAQVGTVVIIVQASDPDGDNVEFTFNGGVTTESVFEIVRVQGMIKLAALVPANMVLYNLNVTAIDDGSCCTKPSSLNSTTVVPIDIKDVNNNSPHFPDCSSYHPTIMENEPTGSPVIQIKAVDDDRGTNGQVTYFLYTNTRFTIGSSSGNITSLVVFDRENVNNIRSYDVTIYARDSGQNPRDGLCTITVDIGDMNDNSPRFESSSYETSVPSTTPSGSTLYRVKANDPDAGSNGMVSYFIIPESNTFRIDDEGVIFLKADASLTGNSQTITVKAEDNGSPTNLSSTATVKFTISGDLVNKPTWDAGLDGKIYEVNETAAVNTIVGTLCADSRTAGVGVSFSILGPEGPTTASGKFAIQSALRENCTNLIVNSALDAEQVESYEVRLRVTSLTINPLSDEIRVTINVLDENDQVPVFGRPHGEDHFISGSIMENGTVGSLIEIITITATDGDIKAPNNEVYYSLEPTEANSQLFQIRSGDGTLSSSHIFDREQQSYYYLSVIGHDGAPSVRPNMNGKPNSATAQVRILILDANDNPPYFTPEQYSFSVEESAETNFLVGTVTATDPDTVINQDLLYSIMSGNSGNAFTITQYTGEIKVNGILDYEGPYKHYTLKVRASDGLHEAYGTVNIAIIDVNDNRPVFSQKIYIINDIVEEDTNISATTPRFLITVNATDADVDRPNKIEYRLQDDSSDVQAMYNVNSITGQVYLKMPLDRDPTKGRVLYEFTILAIDEPQSDNFRLGYATIQIYPIDLNDNQPKFDSATINGAVEENSKKGTSVMTVVATDPDEGLNGTVYYTIVSGPMDSQGNNYFKINDNGLIQTESLELDRENKTVYFVTIVARDGGKPPQSSTGTVTIVLIDVNDNAPVFHTKIFKTTMSESLVEHSSVMSVTATDKDIDDNARLTYRLEGSTALEHFYMETVQVSNTGVLRLYSMIDYDTIANSFFNLTVVVSDPKGSEHSDTAYIEVSVEDYNDNAPQFDDSYIMMRVPENIPVETSLAEYHAIDIDSGINKEFYYSIDRSTDKNRQFRIEDYGNGTASVFVRRPLDRETDASHKVHVLATDKGTPAQTGTGTLSLILLDINDNYPIFKQDYRPVVYENQPANSSVVLIFAIDLDTEINAGDFFFSLPCTKTSSPCCTDNPTCQDFFMQFNRDGDAGRGTGLISSRANFDRETQKYYYVPIIMSDSGIPLKMTGTNTLTVTIGDINDNEHYPGHLDSYVYNYRGKYGDIIVGRVFAEDRDDWDIVDKTFILTGPPKMKNYFEVDKDSGAITMFKGVPEGNYTFEATVYDKVFDKIVTSTVTVYVKEISEQAVYNSGSIRFSGITDEEFIFRPNGGLSKYDTLRQVLATTLNTATENVEVFSVMQNGKYLDVRYAAHGSPWYKASKMDGLVDLQRNQIDAALGQDMTIVMVNIDECLDEICESGGCTNIFGATDFPTTITANGTALVGVTTTLTSECTCRARNFTSPLECTPDHCYNNGTCTKNKWNVVECSCPAGFDGPRCQQTHQSFNGKGYALYPTLEQCEESRTSIEFITLQADGLILYNGPVHDLDTNAGDQADFIALELVQGYPRLLINHGTGTLVLTLDGRNKDRDVIMQPLNEGLWHRIDIIRKGRDVWLVADYCKKAVPALMNVMLSVEDRAPCEAFGRTPGENAFINVNTMLQLGGRYALPVYPADVMQTGFNGCVKNLIHNSELYDLHIGSVGLGSNNNDRCLGEEEVCGVNNAVDPYCGANGICIGSLAPQNNRKCHCKPKYRMGRNSQICDTSTSIRDFRDPNSFMEWDFKDEMYNQLLQNPRTFAIQIMFRTNDNAGTIFRAQSAADQNDFVELKLRDGNVEMVYDVGEVNVILQLADAPASNGVWHVLALRRYDRQFILSMDGGEGRYYIDTFGPATGDVEFKVTKSQIFVGAQVTYQAVNQASNQPVVDSSTDLNEACINDVRYGYEYHREEWFPMKTSENAQSFAAILAKEAYVGENCVRTDCQGAICPPGLICEPMWGRYECWCPPDMKKVGQDCKPKGCDDEPCFGLSTCEPMTDGTGFLCHCPPGFTGRTCNMHVDYSSRAAGLTTEALVVILVCLFLILVLVVAFILYFRTHKPMDKLILEVDPDDDIRENIINYDEEGAGEDDKGEYDISRLRKPEDGGVLPRKYPLSQQEHMRPLGRGAPNDNPDVGDFIEDRLNDADGDPSAPPHDSVRVFEYEGGGSDAGSLSSLNTSTSSGDKDYYFLNDWGPKFSKLADMYGGGQSDED